MTRTRATYTKAKRANKCQDKPAKISANAEEPAGAENARWIEEIGKSTKTISNVTGKVQCVFSTRPTANCNEDNGPLCENASEVFSAKIKAHEKSNNSPNMITVFFYDKWAQKCSFIEPEHEVTISGGSNLIQKASEKDGEKGDHRFCLCIGGPQFSAKALRAAGAAFELTVKEPPTISHKGAQVTLNPKNFRKEKILYPFRIHYEPRKRQKKGKENKLKSAKNTAASKNAEVRKQTKERKRCDYTLLGTVAYPKGPKTRSEAAANNSLSFTPDNLHCPIVDPNKKRRCRGCRISNPSISSERVSETQKRCDTCKDEEGKPVPLCVAKGKDCWRKYHEAKLFGMHK